MKIDDRVSNYMALLNRTETKSAARPEANLANQAISETPSASVAISPVATQLADDEAHRERLNIIRQQLAAGSYNISGKDVADKMLNALKG